MFQQYIRCCPFLPIVGCLLTLNGATPRRGGQLPRGEIRLQEEVLGRDPLAQRGRQSGLNKDALNEGHRPKNRWAPTPKPASGIPLLFNSAGIFVLFSAVGGACPRSWYFQDIDYVGSEVPGNSSYPPTRWCSPEARLSPTVSCPMSWRGSDGTMAIDGLFIFWPCYSSLWSFSAFSVVPAVSLPTVLLVLLFSSVFLVS